MCVCIMCIVCMCVTSQKRDREGQTEREGGKGTKMHMVSRMRVTHDYLFC